MLPSKSQFKASLAFLVASHHLQPFLGEKEGPCCGKQPRKPGFYIPAKDPALSMHKRGILSFRIMAIEKEWKMMSAFVENHHHPLKWLTTVPLFNKLGCDHIGEPCTKPSALSKPDATLVFVSSNMCCLRTIWLMWTRILHKNLRVMFIINKDNIKGFKH